MVSASPASATPAASSGAPAVPGLLDTLGAAAAPASSDDAPFDSFLEEPESADEEKPELLDSPVLGGVAPDAPPPAKARQDGLESMLATDDGAASEETLSASETTPLELSNATAAPIAPVVPAAADPASVETAPDDDAPIEGSRSRSAAGWVATWKAAAQTQSGTDAATSAEPPANLEGEGDPIVATELTAQMQNPAATPASQASERALAPNFGRFIREMRHIDPGTARAPVGSPENDKDEGAELASAEMTSAEPEGESTVFPLVRPNLAPVSSARHYDRNTAALAAPVGDTRAAGFRQTEASAAGDALPIAGPVASPARIAEVGTAGTSATVEPVMQICENVMQDVVQQVVKPSLRTIGIDPAEVTSVMEFVAPDRTSSDSASGPGLPEPALALGATRTLQHVLRTADLMQAGDRSGLRLRLDFGESGPLSVQITLRQGRVHTLFRSDSPELRDSIAQAWTNFAQRSDAALPLAEPVLLPMRNAAAPTDGGRWNGAAGQDLEGRSDRQAREARGEALVNRTRSRRGVGSGPVTTATAPGVLTSSSNHLRALA